MDRVFIEGLEVETVIGAYDWERNICQCLRLDLSFAWDNRPAAAGDDLSLALDYATVTAHILAFAKDSRFELVETFAERLVAKLMADFGIPWMRLKLTKPGAVPEARGGVGVEIERGCL
ncbi:dihydroneopterin aldolase [Pseudomonas sp. NPDC089554]|uniref:dihydroneopterin aldolase n=1 Tax=Pseudomonas sp. NPDC089554 TaxID=3390653 RepID=UPI003D03CED1